MSSRPVHQIPSFRVSVEAVAIGLLGVAILIFLLLDRNANASTDSSWVSQPSWAANINDNNGSNGDNNRSSGNGASATSEHRYRRESKKASSPFAPGSNNVALEMGQVFLMGDLGNTYSDSIGLRVNYTYGVSDLFAFSSSLGYSNHSDGHFSMTSVMTGLRTNLAWYDKVVPYFGFGLGFYKPSFTGGTIADSQTQSPLAAGENISPLLFGVYAGPGVDLELTRDLFFGASLTFQDAFGKTELAASGTPISVGGTFTSFFLHVGMTF